MLSKKEVEIYKIDLAKLSSNIKRLEKIRSYLYKREQKASDKNIIDYFSQYENYPGIKIVHKDRYYHIYFHYLHIFTIYDNCKSEIYIKRKLYDTPFGKDEVDGAIDYVINKFKNSDGYLIKPNEGSVKHKEIYDRYHNYYSIIGSRIKYLENGVKSILIKINSDIDEIKSTMGTIFLAKIVHGCGEIPLFCLIRKGKLITQWFSGIKKDDIKINKLKIVSDTTKMFNVELFSDTNVVYKKRINKEKFWKMIPNSNFYRWFDEEQNELLVLARKYWIK
jgi:hypothetical protein